MSEVTLGIIGLLVLLGMFLTGIELGFAMTIIGFIGYGASRPFPLPAMSL
jgi:hypothetical protein